MNNLEADEWFMPGDKEEGQPGGWCLVTGEGPAAEAERSPFP